MLFLVPISSEKNFRFNYFSSLDNDKLNLISKELNLDLNSKREKIISYCSSLKWEKNYETIKICEIFKQYRSKITS